MPEPLLGESITDLDGTEAGELEVDVTGLSRRPGDLWTGELEVEWRALTRLGLSLEAGAAHQGAGSGVATSLRPSASFVLFHDPVRDLHLMLDASVRLLENDSEAEPGEPALPLAFSLRGGIRRGPLTLRGALGGGAGGHSAHTVPLRAQGAALLEAPFGFWGIEADGDFARSSPWVLAPELVLGTRALHVGVAMPWELGAGRLGAFVRLIFEVDQE